MGLKPFKMIGVFLVTNAFINLRKYAQKLGEKWKRVTVSFLDSIGHFTDCKLRKDLKEKEVSHRPYAKRLTF